MHDLQFRRSQTLEAIIVSLEVISSYLAVCDPTDYHIGQSLRNELAATNLLKFCGKWLNVSSFPKKNTSTSEASDYFKFTEEQMLMKKEIYIASLRLLSNLVHGCKLAQASNLNWVTFISDISMYIWFI